MTSLKSGLARQWDDRLRSAAKAARQPGKQPRHSQRREPRVQTGTTGVPQPFRFRETGLSPATRLPCRGHAGGAAVGVFSPALRGRSNSGGGAVSNAPRCSLQLPATSCNASVSACVATVCRWTPISSSVYTASTTRCSRICAGSCAIGRARPSILIDFFAKAERRKWLVRSVGQGKFGWTWLREGAATRHSGAMARSSNTVSGPWAPESTN